jgi:AmmeMemoRadiSam system protein A
MPHMKALPNTPKLLVSSMGTWGWKGIMDITPEDRRTMLTLVRQSVEAHVTERALPAPAPEGVLARRCGCFVTLTNRGRLRGCIGTFVARSPLAFTLPQMASAAAEDPRFTHNPIIAPELPALTVGVSILSELEPIADPLGIELGRHGIYIQRGPAGGCFLPEVATETGWSKEEFLSHCAADKAGLPPLAWQDPRTKVFIFTSDKFSDGPE